MTAHYLVLQLRLDKRIQKVMGPCASEPKSVDAAAEEQGGSGSGRGKRKEGAADGSGSGSHDLKNTRKPGCEGLVKTEKGKGDGDSAVKEGAPQLHQILQYIEQVLCFSVFQLTQKMY